MEVLYQDKNIVVCIKPVGLDSEKQVVEILKEQLGGDIYPLHRLDLNVGGIMVYARHSKSAALFSKMIQNNEMVKEYVAMVHGQLNGMFGKIIFLKILERIKFLSLRKCVRVLNKPNWNISV